MFISCNSIFLKWLSFSISCQEAYNLWKIFLFDFQAEKRSKKKLLENMQKKFS